MECECVKTANYYEEPCRHPATWSVSGIYVNDIETKTVHVCRYHIGHYRKVSSYEHGPKYTLTRLEQAATK